MTYNAQMLLLQLRPVYLCQRQVLRPTADSSHVCSICWDCKLLERWLPAAEQDTLWTAVGQTKLRMHFLHRRTWMHTLNRHGFYLLSALFSIYLWKRMQAPLLTTFFRRHEMFTGLRRCPPATRPAHTEHWRTVCMLEINCSGALEWNFF